MLNQEKILTKKNIAAILGVAIFFLTDRWLKSLALSLPSGKYQELIEDYLVFRFTANFRIAFSLPLSGSWLPLTILIAIAILIFYAYKLASKPGHLLEIFSIIMVIVGAISNLADRLLFGYVIDYLELKNFTVFNLADALITIGACLLIIKSIRAR